MNTKNLAFRTLVATVPVLLTACSGPDLSYEISGPGAGPGLVPNWQTLTDGPITAWGINTGDGRLVLNDVAYTSQDAIVTVNGRPALPAELRPGQVVLLRGQIDSGGLTGSADRIDRDARLLGPVETLDASNERLVVMGQAVQAGAGTVFAAGIDPSSYAGLPIGSNVEVSGYARADGTVLATRIEPAAPTAPLRLVGDVHDLDLSSFRFSVGSLTVDYSQALVIDLPGGAPGIGMPIRATGNLAGGRFVVETLAAAPALPVTTGRRLQVAGVVTRFVSSTDFDVNDVAVTTAVTTWFNHGVRNDLALDVELVIDGHAASNGRITAERVSFGR